MGCRRAAPSRHGGTEGHKRGDSDCGTGVWAGALRWRRCALGTRCAGFDALNSGRKAFRLARKVQSFARKPTRCVRKVPRPCTQGFWLCACREMRCAQGLEACAQANVGYAQGRAASCAREKGLRARHIGLRVDGRALRADRRGMVAGRYGLRGECFPSRAAWACEGLGLRGWRFSDRAQATKPGERRFGRLTLQAGLG